MNLSFLEDSSRLWGLIGCFLLLTAAMALGCWAGNCFDSVKSHVGSRSRSDVWVGLTLQVTIGYSLLGWFGAVLDLFQVGTAVVHVTLLSLLAAWMLVGGWRRLRCWSRRLHQSHIGDLAQRHSILAVFGGLVIALVFGLPEAWDELVYHAELPRRWLAAQGLAFFPDLPYSAFPSLVEINSWQVASLDLTLVPRLIPAIFWVLALGMVYANLRLHLEHFLSVTLTLAWGLTETVLLVASGGYVEPVLMTNALLILYLLQLTHRDWSRAAWRMGGVLGLLVGGSAATKLTGMAILLPAVLIWIDPSRFAHKSGKRRDADSQRMDSPWAGILLTFGVTLLFVAPFYLRPWLATGNPVFPYFDQWFTQDLARIESSQFHHAIGGEKFGMRGWAAVVLAPLFLSFDQAIYDGTFGWQSCILHVLILVQLWKLTRGGGWDWLVVKLSVTTVGLFLAWYGSAQQARFAIAAELSMLILAATMMRDLPHPGRSWFAGATLLLALLSAPWPTANFYMGAWLANMGLISRTSEVQEALGSEYLDLVQAVEQYTAADSRVLMVLEQRGFYVPRTTRIGTPFFQAEFFTPPEAFANEQAVLRVVAEQDITHIVLASRPLGPDIPELWASRFPLLGIGIEQAALAGSLRVVWFSDTYQLLEVVQVPNIQLD